MTPNGPFLVFVKMGKGLPCICPVKDHRKRQNMERTSVTQSTIASCATFLVSPHFDVHCDSL